MSERNGVDVNRFVRRLKRLEKDWPENLWCFANGQKLYVLETSPNGERMMTDRDGGVDEDYVVAALDIPSDGGDW